MYLVILICYFFLLKDQSIKHLGRSFYFQQNFDRLGQIKWNWSQRPTRRSLYAFMLKEASYWTFLLHSGLAQVFLIISRIKQLVITNRSFGSFNWWIKGAFDTNLINIRVHIRIRSELVSADLIPDHRVSLFICCWADWIRTVNITTAQCRRLQNKRSECVEGFHVRATPSDRT